MNTLTAQINVSERTRRLCEVQKARESFIALWEKFYDDYRDDDSLADDIDIADVDDSVHTRCDLPDFVKFSILDDLKRNKA